jgi:hypothetical protein
MTDTERLIAEVDAFQAKTGMTDTTLGRLAVNDGHLMVRARKGRVTLVMAERIREFIANYGTTRATNQEASPAQP